MKKRTLFGLLFVLILGFTYLQAQAADFGALQAPKKEKIVAGSGIQFKNITLTEALQLAKQEGKPVFMDAYASWCGPCKYMANTIFPQSKMGEYFNERFVNVKYDMEKGEGVALRTRYGVTAYPTFLILDGSGKELGRIVGGDDADIFIKKVEGLMAKVR